MKIQGQQDPPKDLLQVLQLLLALLGLLLQVV